MKNCLRAKLREMGRSLLSVSEATGIEYSKLSRFQNRKEDLSRSEVEKIASHLKCSPSDIVPEDVWTGADTGEIPDEKPPVAMRKVVLPEGTAKRAEEVLQREGYEDLNDLVADAVRRLVEGAEERIIQLRNFRKPNGSSPSA